MNFGRLWESSDGIKLFCKIVEGIFMDNDFVEIGMSEEEFERQYVEATRRGEERFARAPKAVSANFDRQTKLLIIELNSGAVLMIPTELMQGLRGASAELISEVELWMDGMYLHWEKLDADFEVSSLLRGVFGTQKWMAELSLLYVRAEDVPQQKRVA